MCIILIQLAFFVITRIEFFDDFGFWVVCYFQLVSNTILTGLHSVAVSKWFYKGNECVVKEFIGFCVIDTTVVIFIRQERSTLSKINQFFWEFDTIREFVGQDILTQLSTNLPKRHHYQNVSPAVFLPLFFFVSLYSTNNFSAVSFFLPASPLLLLSRLLLDTSCVKECSMRRQHGCAFLLFDTALICCCSFSMVCSGTNNFFVTSYFFSTSFLLLHSRLLLGICAKDCSLSLQSGSAFLLFDDTLLCCYSFSMIDSGSLTAVWLRSWFSCGPSPPDIIFLTVALFCLQPDTDYCSRFAILTPLFLVPERIGRYGSLSLTVEAPWYPETGAAEPND